MKKLFRFFIIFLEKFLYLGARRQENSQIRTGTTEGIFTSFVLNYALQLRKHFPRNWILIYQIFHFVSTVTRFSFISLSLLHFSLHFRIILYYFLSLKLVFVSFFSALAKYFTTIFHFSTHLLQDSPLLLRLQTRLL